MSCNCRNGYTNPLKELFEYFFAGGLQRAQQKLEQDNAYLTELIRKLNAGEITKAEAKIEFNKFKEDQ